MHFKYHIALSHRKYKTNHQGVALVIVLWIIVLLSVIGISHSRNVRIDMQMARHYVEKAKARALAESGVSRAIYELFNNDSETIWSFNGQLYELNFPAGQTKIMIRNTAGLVDINSATFETLETLLNGIDLDREQRISLLDAILDWKDADDLKRLNGAEDVDYRSKEYEYRTPDRDFMSIGELRYVMGMNNSIYNTLSPYITIYSGQKTISHEYAPKELSILFGGNIYEINEPLDKPFDLNNGNILKSDSISQLTAIEEEQENEESVTTTGFRQGKSRGVYHISVWSTTLSGASAGLEVDVDTTQKSDKKYTILSWHESSQ
jgi:general secretion pathway protein K